MKIELRLVDSKSLLKEFIYLPEKIYRGDSRWVPPMYVDEWNFHNPEQNKALAYSDVIRLLAYQNGKIVGRIMGIINKKYNTDHGEHTVRFFALDCVNDQTIAHALIQHIEQWGKEKGMTKIIGPYGFSDKDPQGLQIEGLELLPVLATPTNPSYLQALVEQEGYTKELDCVSYHIPVPEHLSVIHQKVYDRIAANQQVTLIEFTSKKQLKPYIVPVFRLVNETYAPIFGFVPMTEDEMKKFAAQYLPVLDPAFVKVVVNMHHEIVAFVVSMPEMSAGIQKAKGRLFPFGFIHILRAMRKTKQLNLLLGAIKKEYRGKGINVLMGKAIMNSARKRGMNVLDSHLILETNVIMRAECEKLGGAVRKRYRVYGKGLRD
jgi:GNAT superfamily N-acetyltransferase